jgi:hypothetical protein
MADEMVARLEQIGDQSAVRIEVDPVDRRIGREPGPVEDEEFEAIRERALSRPRSAATDDAAVDEDEALHGAILDGLRSAVLSA